MSVIPQVACKRCGKEFSALRPRCPYCGTRRVKTGDRVPLTTSSQNRGTPAAERAVINTKWQMIFGMILLAAVILAVIVLVTVGLNEAKADTAAAPQNTPIANTPTPVPATPDVTETDEPESSAEPQTTDDPEASDAPEATASPEPSATPEPGAVQSITLLFFGSPRTEFAAAVGDEVQLKAQLTPDSDKTVTWSSADSSVATVNNGLVKGVGPGTTTITATCDGVSAKCIVYITG